MQDTVAVLAAPALRDAIIAWCFDHGWYPISVSSDPEQLANLVRDDVVQVVITAVWSPDLQPILDAGGRIELARPESRPATAAAAVSLADALQALVDTGRLSPDEASGLLVAAGHSDQQATIVEQDRPCWSL